MSKRTFAGFVLLSMAAVSIATSAGATCYPIKTDVVSLGEAAARHYAAESMKRAIEEKRASLTASGHKISRVTAGELSCVHFPNVLGADEWRCTALSKVCTQK